MSAGAEIQAPQRIPFDLEFQVSLIKLLLDDAQFGAAVGAWIKPEFFEDESLAWAWRTAQAHAQKYHALPAVATLRQYAMHGDPRMQQLHYAMALRIEQSVVRDEEFMRDAVIDFCRRNIFTAAVRQTAREYNAGNIDDAYEHLARATEQIEKATWRTPDATFFCEDLHKRHMKRLCGESQGNTIATGIHELDHLLGGGLSKGELGTWISYPKAGKSTLLINLGVVAVRSQMRRCAHFVFEGARSQAEDRYEAAFTQECYQELKRGMTHEAYRLAWEQYQYMKRSLWLQALVEEWDYTVADVTESLRMQKRAHGWEPDVVIIDYGDLLSGRDKPYRSETAKQKAAFRDLKMLATRGYATWTASQVQRPKEGAEDKAHWLYARQIADAYEKVRVCDFIGSINQTMAEREAKVIRLFGELYRDNEANLKFLCECDFARMHIGSGKGLISPSLPDVQSGAALGMKVKQAPEPTRRPEQLRAPLT